MEAVPGSKGLEEPGGKGWEALVWDQLSGGGVLSNVAHGGLRKGTQEWLAGPLNLPLVCGPCGCTA